MFLKQVHGLHAVQLDADTPDGIEADGCVTTTPRRRLHDHGGRLPAGAVHHGATAARWPQRMPAGAAWPAGAGRNILEAVWVRLRELAPAARVLIKRWPGWALASGPQAFEVGARGEGGVRVARSAGAAALFKPHGDGKWLADLPGLARRRLHALGITRVYGNDGSREWCTVSNPSRFFSHRRDRVSGRFAAGIWLA